MRREAREIAFKLIFESEFNSVVDVNLSFDSMAEDTTLSEDEKSFAYEIYNSFEKNRDEIRNLISSVVKEYEIGRIYKVDLALIELAYCEFKFVKTPLKIVVNETLELAKKYSTDNSYKFLNGVLSTLLKD